MEENKKRGKKLKEADIIQEIFNLKCYKLFSDYQIKNYLVDVYGYTHQTAQKYSEKLHKKMKEEINIDYEDALRNMIEYLKNEIQTTEDKFLKINYIKELNKIQNLGNKKEIDITSGGEPINYVINISVDKDEQ